MKKPFFSKIILTLGLVIFLLPLISSAFVSTGAIKCTPDSNDGTQDVKCQFDNQSGSNILPLKWVIPGNVPSDPYPMRECFIECTRADGKECANLGRVISGSNQTLILSDDPTASGRDIFPEDAALVKKPEAGNIYQAACYWWEVVSTSPFNSVLKVAKSHTTEVVGVPCNQTFTVSNGSDSSVDTQSFSSVGSVTGQVKFLKKIATLLNQLADDNNKKGLGCVPFTPELGCQFGSSMGPRPDNPSSHHIPGLAVDFTCNWGTGYCESTAGLQDKVNNVLNILKSGNKDSLLSTIRECTQAEHNGCSPGVIGPVIHIDYGIDASGGVPCFAHDWNCSSALNSSTCGPVY